MTNARRTSRGDSAKAEGRERRETAIGAERPAVQWAVGCAACSAAVQLLCKPSKQFDALRARVMTSTGLLLRIIMDNAEVSRPELKSQAGGS